jgi:hypothetical protein
MDLLESLQNTIFFSNKTLQKLEESKYTINKINDINENNKKQISYADKILESFKSFYNRINYTKDTDIEKTKTIITNNITTNIIIEKLDALEMLKKIKENNYLIGNELDQQNNLLCEITEDVYENNYSLAEAYSKIEFS